MRYSNDAAGPFAGDGPMRVFVDLPVGLRQVETGSWKGPSAPVPEHLLWGLSRSRDIEVYWLAETDETGEGAVRLQEPDLSDDQWPFTCTKADGNDWLGGISQYRQLLRAASRDATTPLETYVKAALSQALRAHITVTNDPMLLDLSGPYSCYCNPLNTADALAAVGLCLRRKDPTVVASTTKYSVTHDTHALAWIAVRSQLPSGWAWGSALVDHSATVNDDYATLLFGSFYERLVRMLNHRDGIHRAALVKANHRTGLEATEALDTMMFNIVGAFDAAAIAAHMGAGRSSENRKRAGWQWKEWRKELGVPHLYEMFHQKKPAEDLLTVCRTLRNTVHGAGLSSTVSFTASGQDTLVRLPQAEAGDLVERLNRLASADTWGVEVRIPNSVHIDPARLAEGLIPLVFTTLEEVLAHTPLDHLAGLRKRRDGPPTDGPFDFNTRTRACLLYGLRPPST